MHEHWRASFDAPMAHCRHQGWNVNNTEPAVFWGMSRRVSGCQISTLGHRQLPWLSEEDMRSTRLYTLGTDAKICTFMTACTVFLKTSLVPAGRGRKWSNDCFALESCSCGRRWHPIWTWAENQSFIERVNQRSIRSIFCHSEKNKNKLTDQLHAFSAGWTRFPQAGKDVTQQGSKIVSHGTLQ